VLTFLLGRVSQTVPTLLGSTIVVFLLVHLTGDPALLMLPPDAPPSQVEAFRASLGFDRPLPVQYWEFLKGIARGDLGESFRFRAPALDLVVQRLPATVQLAGLAVAFAALIGIPLGVLSATTRGSWIDTLARGTFFLGQGIPPFWLGLMLMVVFSVQLGLLPSSGRGTASQLIMPVATLTVFLTASLARLTRGGMIQALQEDYVRTARAKGLPPRIVLFKHAIRNTLIPVVTMIGLQIGHLLGGAVVTETIFAWPGIGRLVVDAVHARDFPVVQAAMLVIVALFVFVNLTVDLLYGLLDPRIRYE
jgi:ABC-type dipeptide/oligopeptide/nickel transport system permease component